jgi:nucleoid-associated protein YgaU
MGSVALAVLEFDEAVQVPWRPRLVHVSAPPASPRGHATPASMPRPAGDPTRRRPHAARAGRLGAGAEVSGSEVSQASSSGAAAPVAGRHSGRMPAVQASRRAGRERPAPAPLSRSAGVRAGSARPGARAAAPGLDPALHPHVACRHCVAGDHRRRVRLTARARRLVTGLAVAVAVAAGAWVGGVVAGGEQALELVGESRVVVQPGDTVWDIARSVAGDDQDVRAVVNAIERRNDLVGGRLVPGQVLVLP